VIIMVNETLIVPLHVPKTIVNSSVAIRDVQTPHLINIMSWWMRKDEKKDNDPHDGANEKRRLEKMC